MSVAPPLARWDAGWYREITVNGYSYNPNKSQNTIGFYPAYPLIVRGVSKIWNAEPFRVGTFVSGTSLVGACAILAVLLKSWGSDLSPLLTVAAILFFPTSFFLAAPYSESTFFFFTVLLFWAMRREKWILAGFAAAAAALTRFAGLTVLVPVTVWCLQSILARDRRRAERLGALAIAVAGALAYPLYLWRKWGDFLLYIHDKQKGWPKFRAGHFGSIFSFISFDFNRLAQSHDPLGILVYVLQVGGLILLLATAIALFRRGLLIEASYVTATLALLLGTGTLDAIQRFVLVVFPSFAVLATWLKRWSAFRYAYLFAGAAAGMALAACFIHWIYIG